MHSEQICPGCKKEVMFMKKVGKTWLCDDCAKEAKKESKQD
jgi:ribosomal protein L37AE/L43A